jgi:hypothetical protein
MSGKGNQDGIYAINIKAFYFFNIFKKEHENGRTKSVLSGKHGIDRPSRNGKETRTRNYRTGNYKGWAALYGDHKGRGSPSCHGEWSLHSVC